MNDKKPTLALKLIDSREPKLAHECRDCSRQFFSKYAAKIHSELTGHMTGKAR